jgi:hypothetical protein
MADGLYHIRNPRTGAEYDLKLQDNGDGTHSFGVEGVVTVSLPAAIYSGQKAVAVAGTQEALAASQALVAGVHIKAKATNTGNVYVGGATVDSATGLILAAGEAVFLEVANLATVWLDVDTGTEGVSFLAS